MRLINILQINYTNQFTTGHDSYIERYNRKNRLKQKKRFSLGKKLSKIPQTNTITDIVLTGSNKPNFAWMD